MSHSPAQLAAWQAETAGQTPTELLSWAAGTFPGQVVFASSLGVEDQVLTDLIARHELPIPIFTLDTGRLFQETHELLQRTEERYGLRLRVLFPDRDAVEEMVAAEGINLFRRSVALRQRCCGVRKLEPLRRALAGQSAWIVGLRREQSVTRDAVAPVSWDEANGLVKLSPLHDWSGEQVWSYVREHDVPYNELHDRGFPSIGCASCTRAVRPGEDARAGRWWWERPEQRECGLHWVDGKLVRAANRCSPIH